MRSFIGSFFWEVKVSCFVGTARAIDNAQIAADESRRAAGTAEKTTRNLGRTRAGAEFTEEIGGG